MVATFAYDAGSRRTSRTLGDTPGTLTAWVYGRHDNLPTAINAGIPGASFTYTCDSNKNKLTEGISAPMANFGFNSTAYDQADRLTAWNRTDGNLDQAWNLSLVGDWATFTENQVQQTRSHTAVHEIAAIDSNPIAHDPAGNLTRNAGDTLDRYTWDFDNRLATADVDQDGMAECGYQYDALGRRVSKSVPDGEGSATTVFVCDGGQVVAEYVADAVPGSLERKFVYADYIDEPVLMVTVDNESETPYYYHQNSLYSVAALTDATGTVVERYAYSAYGKPFFLDANANLLNPQASIIGNPYLFTGRRLDSETSLYYYRARMYDAELGRFVSRDPIGYEGGDSNLYTYVHSSPIVFRDPSGMSVDRPLLEQNCCGDCLRTTYFPLPFDVSQIQGQPSWEGDCPEKIEWPTVLPHLLEHGFNRGPFPKRKQEIINEIGCSNAQRHFDEDGHLLEDELGQPQVERCKCVFYDSSSVTDVAIEEYSYTFYWQWKNQGQKQDPVFVPHPVPPGFEHVPKFFRGPCTFKASVELPYAISTDMGRCEWGL